MEIYRTDDNQVTKFIHDDDSETCIKTVSSIDYKPNPETGEVDVKVTDRNKYSVFISASAGCPMNCSFCYLTIDEMRHGKLYEQKILENLKQAIEIESRHNDIANRYVKVCWMGMGEGIIQSKMVRYVTTELLDWIMENNYALGLDGVDISTVLPDLPHERWIDDFAELNKDLEKYPLNPNNKNVVNKESGSLVEYANRSRFRLFYSLHSAVQSTRDEIIPKAKQLHNIIRPLHNLEWGNVDVIIHHMFLEGINDSEEELDALIEFMNEHFEHNELRILRYNKHDRSEIRESDTFEKCMCYISGKIEKTKVQVSQGLDVKSACGQFIYNNKPEIQNFKISD